MTVVDTAKKLIETPSVIGDEHDLAHQVAERLEGVADVELQAVEGFGPNVVARRPGRAPDAPTVVLNGHLDTVPVQGAWTKDPFDPVVERKRLYGLGACDMKGGDACLIEAFERVAPDVDLDLVLALTTDEEGHCAGAYKLFEAFALDPDLVLIPEATGEDPMLGARGRAAFDVTVRAKGGHGARPHETTNAVDEAARVVQALPKLDVAEHPTLPPATATPLRIQAGNYSLSVPAACTITVDRHLVPPETTDSAKAQLETFLDGLDLAEGFDVAPIDRPTPFLEPYVFSGSEPPIGRLLRFYEEHFQAEPEIAYASSVGDFNVFARHGPTVVLGPRGEDMHRGDEWVSTESLHRITGFYEAFLGHLDAAGVGPADEPVPPDGA